VTSNSKYEDHREDNPAEDISRKSLCFPDPLVLIRIKVDIDPEKTVGDLKAKIEEDHAHPVAAQRIIFSGPPLFFSFRLFI